MTKKFSRMHCGAILASDTDVFRHETAPGRKCAKEKKRKRLKKRTAMRNSLRFVGAGIVSLAAFILSFPEAQAEDPSATWKTGEAVVYTYDGEIFEMMPCPAGRFTMGSPRSERGRNINENEHVVTISKPFLLGKYEVTQRQWKAVMGNNPSHFKERERYSYPDGLPVERVSWDDAKQFCEKMNKRHAEKLPRGYRFDLPTEAQWEYACRAGKTTALNNGQNLTDRENCPNLNGWYSGNSNGKTQLVGRRGENAWGLYDMHGNVWEWCRDRYADYDLKATFDPTGPTEGSMTRVRRGGSWNKNARHCRSAYRYYDVTDRRSSEIGFRLALVPFQTEEEQRKAEERHKALSSGDFVVDLPGNIKLAMVNIKAGSLEPGSPAGEKAGDSNEIPHQVTLTQDFHIGKTEVTLEQWIAVMGRNPSNDPAEKSVSRNGATSLRRRRIAQKRPEATNVDPPKGKGKDHPIDRVSWYEAMEFCKELNRMGKAPAGMKFTLPTEAQWEYAARGGNKSKGYRYSGSDNIDEVAWYGDNADRGTHPVGEKKPNELGIYDMSGNVWEWCLDNGNSDGGKAVPEFTRRNDTGSSSRVFRGGGWNNLSGACRSENRDNSAPRNRFDNLGFRIVLVPIQ